MGNKNYHGIERLKHGEVKARVLGLVTHEMAISKLQICRCLNGRDISYCKYAMGCYANIRKRTHYLDIFRPDCLISFDQVRYALKKLVQEGQISVTREEWPDHLQPRGYDNMAICRPMGYLGDSPNGPWINDVEITGIPVTEKWISDTDERFF